MRYSAVVTVYVLVGGVEHVLFVHILGIVIPTDFHSGFTL